MSHTLIGKKLKWQKTHCFIGKANILLFVYVIVSLRGGLLRRRQQFICLKIENVVGIDTDLMLPDASKPTLHCCHGVDNGQ